MNQPPPIPNGTTPIWDLVKADIDTRDATGFCRYGTRLQAFNGRDSLQDLYEELLDAVVYIRTVIEEQRARDAIILAIAQDVARTQPNFPDTHTGARQQWVRDEIIRRLADLQRDHELLQKMYTCACDRIAAQSDLLSRKAEKP